MKTTKLVLVLLGGLLFAAGAFAQAGGPVAISCPTEITMLASGSGGAVVFYTATASGGCQPPPLLVCNPPSGSTFPVGTNLVTCIANDTCGQTANCGFRVTVQPALRHIYLSTDLLPPANGMYVSPAQWHALYANGIIISNVVHRRFSQGTLPPGPGVPLTHSFGSQVDFDVSLDGGQTFMHESAPAQVTVSLQANATATGVFDTEMLQLDIAGGTLPAGVMIRESPTLASTGQTQVQSAPGAATGSVTWFDVARKYFY